MIVALLKWALAIAFAAYAGIVLYMFLQQRSLQYHPENKGLTPAGVGLPGVSEHEIATPDGERIIAWYAEGKPGKPVILFLHGNAGEIGDRTGRFTFYRDRGFGVLFVSYRGFGGSSGTISEAGLVTDGLSAHDWLVARGVRPEHIALVGESLGTGVAVQVAAARAVGAVALEAPYTATVDVGALMYPWLPVRLLMKDQFLSREYIGKVHAPLLIQHGAADTLIPVEQGRRLFELANEPKELVILDGLGHDAVTTPGVWARETAFFEKYLAPQ